MPLQGLSVDIMPDNSFDIVRKIDLAEVANAIQQAMKEVSTRFDLKDSKSQIAMEGTDAKRNRNTQARRLCHYQKFFISGGLSLTPFLRVKNCSGKFNAIVRQLNSPPRTRRQPPFLFLV